MFAPKISNARWTWRSRKASRPWWTSWNLAARSYNGVFLLLGELNPVTCGPLNSLS